jgi:hypothetical protein
MFRHQIHICASREEESQEKNKQKGYVCFAPIGYHLKIQ